MACSFFKPADLSTSNLTPELAKAVVTAVANGVCQFGWNNCLITLYPDGESTWADGVHGWYCVAIDCVAYSPRVLHLLGSALLGEMDSMDDERLLRIHAAAARYGDRALAANPDMGESNYDADTCAVSLGAYAMMRARVERLRGSITKAWQFEREANAHLLRVEAILPAEMKEG